MNEETKICKSCKVELPLSDFYIRKENNLYRRSCKKCCNGLKHSNPDSILERRKLTEKKCIQCNSIKPVSEFNFSNYKKCVYQTKCKECIAGYKKERYWANREAELEKLTRSRTKPENILQRKEYYKKNKDEYRERHLKYQADETKREHKRKVGAEYEKNNKDKIRLRAKAHRQKPEVAEERRNYHNVRKQTDIEYVLKRRLRCRLRHEVKRVGEKKFNKTYTTMEFVGCDIETLKLHLQSKFTDGMNWEKVFSGEIHVDHIKPCKSFDLTKKEDQIACFRFENLQPLWAVDNLIKGAKYEELQTT